MPTGFCFICGIEVEEDILTHLDENHSRPTPKPNVPVMPWDKRLQQVAKTIEEILGETDVAKQLRLLDEDVIQEAYLVRARLIQMRPPVKVKEGLKNGSS